MVKDGRTAVTDAGTAVAASLVKAGKAYDIVLALQDAANETDVTAKAAMAAIKKIDGESSKDPKTTLKNAWRNSTGALSHARPIMWASEDLRKDGKATKFAKQAMAFIDAKLEAALRPTVSSRTAAESALQNVLNELTQLQEEARRLDQREKEELKKKEEELSRLQQAESPTTTTSVPSLKKSGVDGEKVLARRADSTSSNAAWVGAPLMLLLVCVAVW
ncbi:hypothetical protein DQ04_13981020 [Trypanosoma grayi]|uniref:hypothetical protein n=1 Tax=Trypanosoma grayi TaxID=71804 RepID=UPI0004F491CF|nr:hypothetical protein DQ04_13981020 [Trypanosoma grayi]KEG06426.1 hypothetical protein DQ04_13981020 [Trypanosoma grayi]